jgi:hypothetical protein
MALNLRTGLKRASAAVTADNSAAESSDAALARALQFEEYQEPSTKRCKVSGGVKLEIEDSTDDDSALTEISYIEDNDTQEEEADVWQPARKTRNSLRSSVMGVVSDSETNIESDSDSSVDVSPIPERGLGIRSLASSRASARTRTRPSRRSAAVEPRFEQSRMTHRVSCYISPLLSLASFIGFPVNTLSRR